MNIIIKYIKDLFYYYDPTNEYFVTALKATIPSCAGLLCLIYFRWPFDLFIFILPALLLMIPALYSDYKSKIFNMILLCLEICAGQLLISIFYKQQFFLLIVLFVLILVIYSSVKYRMSGGLAVLMIVVCLGLPQGLYNGLYRTIGISIALIISILFLFLFEWFTAKYLIRSTLINVSELVTDSFITFTVTDRSHIDRKIENKYLFKRGFMNRVDIVIEDIYKTKVDKFYHKITTAVFKADKLIEQEEYFFSKNKVFAKKATAAYYFYRRLFRGTAFLSGYFELHNEINKYVPLTDELVLNITTRLKRLVDMLKLMELPETNIDDSDLIRTWRNNLDELKKLDWQNIDKKIIEFYYGLSCILEDMDRLRSLLIQRFNK